MLLVKEKMTKEQIEAFNAGVIEGKKHKKASPETLKITDSIIKKLNEVVTQSTCKENSTNCYKLNLKPMMSDLKEIKEDIKEDRKESLAFRSEIKEIVLKMPGQLRKEFDGLYGTKKDQDRIDRALNKVMWTSVTSLIGFLVTAIWFLIDKTI